MCREILFLPISGGNSISANCYFLKLGQNNILLDCGSSSYCGLVHGPNFSNLLKSGLVHSLEEITHVFISHAHMDHVGYLSQLLRMLPKATVFMTPITEMLTHYQLFDNSNVKGSGAESMEGQMVLENLMQRIRKVNFLDTMDFGGFQVSFYQAGHIPGAMMCLFKYRGKQILYTGDYSFDESLLTKGCLLPEDLQVDAMIMCATNAKQPYHQRFENALQCRCEAVLQHIKHNGNAFCSVPQLSKGLEVLTMLNRLCKARGLKVPIYLDDAMMKMVQRLECLGISILGEYNFFLPFGKKDVPHITIAQDKYTRVDWNETPFNVDFSLHDDYQEMKEFICKINPRKVVLVHCGQSYSEDDSLEQELLWNVECHSSVIYSEDGMVYRLA